MTAVASISSASTEIEESATENDNITQFITKELITKLNKLDDVNNSTLKLDEELTKYRG